MVKSIIDDAIKGNLESLDSYSTSLLQHIDQLSLDESNLSPLINSHITSIKDSFYKTFNLSNKLLSKSQKQNRNLSINKDKLTLKNLKDTLSPFQNGLVSVEIYNDESFKQLPQTVKQDIETICKLEKLILIYNLSLLYIIISNKLLQKTIPLNNDIEYFDNLLNSKLSFSIYCLQKTPSQLYQWGVDLLHDLPKLNISNDITSPKWVPTFADDFYKWLKQFQRLVWKSINENSHKIVSPNFFLLNFQTQSKIPRFDYMSTILGIPFYSLRQGVLSHKQNLLNLQKTNAVKLGLILNELPHFDKSEVNIDSTLEFLEDQDIFDNINETVDKLTVTFEGGDPMDVESTFSDYNTSFVKLNKMINQLIPIHSSQMRSTISQNSKPSLLVRYWILALFGIVYIPSTTATIISRQLEIKQWIQLNLIDSIKGFYSNWIIKPMNQILATIRHDSSSEIAIMSQKSLSSDLDSLTRMAIDLAVDDNSTLSTAELDQLKLEISKSVQSGDLTTIMKNYEHVLKNPMTNLLKGKLLRNLLIQIQKLKVDGDVAMNGIDKLLKSQELVFTVVALSPSLLVVYYILSSINQYWQNGISRFNSSLKPKIHSSLNNIERLLTLSETKDYQMDGMLLLEVIELRSLMNLVIPRIKKYEWVRDCNDLISNEFDLNFKLMTIRRIWNVYSIYI